jgi:hypothetical protein
MIDQSQPAPRPIRTEYAQHPTLDLDLLPNLLREIVESLSNQFQIDPVVPLGTALGCIATATRGKIRARISSDWLEHSSIYICNIAPTAEGKSQVMNLLRQPLIDYEIEMQREARALIDLKQQEHEIALSRLKAIKDSMSSIKKSSKSTPANQADLIDAIELVRQTKPDELPMLLVGGDITPDSLTEKMQSAKHLGMLDAEGDFFDQMSGKSYGSNARWGTVLKATTGDQIKSHRIGRGDGVVNDPFLAICTSVQPDVWLQLHADKSASNRGVTGRFITLVAKSNIGFRDTRAHEKYPIKSELMDDWARVLQTILAIDENRILDLTNAGRSIFQRFRDDWESRLRNPENQRDGFGQRLAGNLITLAALFTLSENPAANQIDDDCLEKTICLADFLLEHRKCADHLKIERVPEQRILDWLAERIPAARDARDVISDVSFSIRGDGGLQQSIKQQAWAKEGKIEAIESALRNLEQWCWIELEDDRIYPRADLLSHRW